MKRRIFSLFCVVAFCLTLLPTTVFAGDTPPTTLTILGQSVIDGNNPTYWTADASGTLTEGTEDSYNIMYDGNGTLTLKDVTITYSTNEDKQLNGIYANGDLTIVLEGKNSISLTQQNTSQNCHGIYLTSGDLTIEEKDQDGKLTLSNAQSTFLQYARNIVTDNGSLKLESGTFDFTVSGTEIGQNLYVSRNLHIGEATVDIKNNIDSGFGIYYRDTMTVSEEATVTITGGEFAINAGQPWFCVGAKRYSMKNYSDIESLKIQGGTATDTTNSSSPKELTNQNVDALYVNGEDILSAPDYTVQCGEGTATYDITKNTLTLDGVTIDSLKPTGSGVVQVNDSYYNNSGKEINVVQDNISVTVGTAVEASDDKGYTWTNENGI